MSNKRKKYSPEFKAKVALAVRAVRDVYQNISCR